jgi:hypothetical protein
MYPLPIKSFAAFIHVWMINHRYLEHLNTEIDLVVPRLKTLSVIVIQKYRCYCHYSMLPTRQTHLSIPVHRHDYLQRLLRNHGGRLDIESSAVKMCEFAARFLKEFSSN